MAKIGIHVTLKAASSLKVMLDAHAADAGQRLGNTLRPWLRDGETLPDLALALRLPARMIEERAQRLRERHDALDGVKTEEDEARLYRDHAASALRRKLIEIRRFVVLAVGTQHAATLLGIEGKTAHQSQHALLLSQAKAVGTLLCDPGKLKIPPTLAGSFDPVSVGEELETLRDALRAALGRFDEARHRRTFQRDLKEDVRTELERTVRALIFLFRGAFLLIGRKDLAENIRRVLPS